MLPDLIPESDLPGVPARNSRGEQSLHVAEEHHAVYTVVLTVGLLLEQHTKREGGVNGSYTCYGLLMLCRQLTQAVCS